MIFQKSLTRELNVGVPNCTTVGGPNLSPCPYRFPFFYRTVFYRDHDRYRTVRGAVWIAVLNNKRITVYILVWYGSRSNTKMRTVTINGSVRFALLTVNLKNGTVTVALAVKKGTVKKRKTVRTRYGSKFGPPTVFFWWYFFWPFLKFSNAKWNVKNRTEAIKIKLFSVLPRTSQIILFFFVLIWEGSLSLGIFLFFRLIIKPNL